MYEHEHLHRRHARAGFPDPKAWADALASALPDPFAEADPSPAQTLVSIVYVTASKTFDGPVGGYTTITAPANSEADTPTPTPTVKADPTTKQTEAPAETSKKASSKVTPETTLKTSGLPSAILPTTASLATSVPLLAATSSLDNKNTPVTESNTASAASSTATSSVSKAGGMSAGGKAGLAIGLLLLFGTVLALILFFFKKRRNSVKQERLDDEKTEIFAGAARAPSTRTTATAPRLSLRPVTQFLPNLGEKRQSRGNALALTPTAATQQPRQSPWEKPMGGQDAARNNPFGNHAEVIDSTNADGPPVVNDVGPGGEIVAAGAAAGAAVGLARGASKRGPNPLDFTKNGPFRGPPSPAGTEFSMSSEAPGTPTQSGTGAAIAAAGGPPNSTVHRVQLDFKPSMDDELELHAGQLVRLLHEYDDGWALCIRLDRSRQGVVPRTCLSTRPVKPRPQQNGPRGPPPPGMRVPGQQPRPMSPGMNQQPRPMSPGMNQGPRSMSPAGNRSQNPQGRPMTPQGRPMTPNGGPQYNPQRPMTPNGQQSRPRSPSAAQMQDRRNSPPGPSPMNPAPKIGSPPGASAPVTRKPVGQAM